MDLADARADERVNRDSSGVEAFVGAGTRRRFFVDSTSVSPKSLIFVEPVSR